MSENYKKILLEDAIHDYKLNPDEFSQNKLHCCFLNLIDEIIEYTEWDKKWSVDKEDMRQEGLLFCFERVARYNAIYNNAYNFFTTSVLSLYRQLYRKQVNYADLKNKYTNHLQQNGKI